MNKLIFLFSSVFLLGAILIFNIKTKEPNNPVPFETQLKSNADEESSGNQRQDWINLMHRSSNDVDWKKIEQGNSQRKFQKDQSFSRSRSFVCEEPDFIINDSLFGIWRERGSRNQSGSVFATEYDLNTNELYTISAGGSIFKGNVFGTRWDVMNQSARFSPTFLELIPTSTGTRMLAAPDELPAYSDDMGLTWTMATSAVSTLDDNGKTDQANVIVTDSTTYTFFLTKKDYWSSLRIFFSSDNGESYLPIRNLSSHDFNTYKLFTVAGTDQIYLIEKTNETEVRLFSIDVESGAFSLEPFGSDFGGFGSAPANMTAVQSNGTTLFYIYNGNNEIYVSNDFCASWTKQGDIPARPWNVGVFASPSNPNFLLSGGFECHYSSDGGASWTLANHWGDYYDDEFNNIHADIMHFDEYVNQDGENVLLISNHGGLSKSDSYMASVWNLGLSGLNVSQYYDTKTDPNDPNYIYAGSQDQGFQRGYSTSSDEVYSFDQVISGDYGHIAMTNNGAHLWVVYPGGWVTYYDEPNEGYFQYSWEVESENESVWIPPLVASPYENDNAVYLAGGHMNGDSGSHLIRLEKGLNGLEVSQSTIDFLAESGGEISAIEFSPLNPDKWYVATTNGRFFYSDDGGDNWEQNVDFVPDGHYLYGQNIYASKIDSNLVYLVGSGYSNPPVFKSIDGGFSFLPSSEGLPSTLVFEVAANEDESILFAATESGPYAYVVEEETWYDMSTACTPNQTFWSVEYVDAKQLVRFGTYGRGIWDFQFEEYIPVSTLNLQNEIESISVYPNPSSGIFNLKIEEMEETNSVVEVYNAAGQLAFSQKAFDLSTEKLDLSHLAKGIFYLKIVNKDQVYSQKLIIQ